MRKNIRKILESEIITAPETGDLNIRAKIRDGKVEAVKKGTVWLIDRRDLE
jgi:hypothetical protein